MKSTLNEGLKASWAAIDENTPGCAECVGAGEISVDHFRVVRPIKEGSHFIDLVTVYRTLSVLKELELVSQLELHQEGQFRYEIRAGREHHHHIRCRTCGKIADLLLCPLKKLQALIEKETQFIVNEHSLEFSGLCPKCQ